MRTSFTTNLVRLAPLALAVSAAPALAVQTPAPAAPGELAAGESADELVDARRILHLADGATLRGRTRRAGERWELRRDGDWVAVPGAVERFTDERAVLVQAKELARKAGNGDVVRRVALADWMLRQGLLAEGSRELDRVLAEHPDQPQALELATDPILPRARLGDDETTQDVLRRASKLSPSMQERLFATLAERERSAEELAELQGTLGSHSDRLRAMAARALRRLYPGEAVRGLLSRSVLDASDGVRKEASLALGAVGDEAVVVPVLRALGSDNGRVRLNAVDALGDMGYMAAIPPLVSRLGALNTAAQAGGGYRAPASHIFVGRQFAYVQDFDVEVAQFESVADPQINVLMEGAVLEGRVQGVTVQSINAERKHIRRSLSRLTGEEVDDWASWWDQHRSEFEREPADPQPGRTRSE